MAVRKISTLVAIDGEAEYKQSISNINTSLKTLKSELAVVDSAYQSNAASVEALSAKKEALTALQTKEAEKVQTLQQAVDNAKVSQEKHAAAYADYTAKIQEAQSAMESLQKETGDTSDQQEQLTAEIEEYRKAQEEARKSQESATSGVEKWQQQLNYAQRDLNNTTASIGEVDKALDTLDFEQVTDDVEETTQALDDLNASLDDVQTGVTQASENLSKAGDTLTMGLTVPLVAAGTAAVNYASNTEESINKVEVAFGDAAEGVKSWSETTLTAYGLAQGTALDMAALYGDMATSMGYSQAAAAEMSMELVSLSADLASFKNISIDEANTALKSIFTGETESLKNLGVVMTEVNLESYAMAQGITTAYSEMDQAEKVALRYEYVLASTENAQGDFSRTSEGTANQLRILQESLKEAAASLGEELLPVVTPVITELSALVQTFADLDDETKQTVVQTGLFLATLGPALKATSGVTTAVTAGIAAYKALTVAQTASTAAQTGMNVAMNANPIGAVVTAVGALVAVLGALAVSTALTTEKTTDLTDSLQASSEAYATTLTGIQEQAKSVQTMVDALTALEQVENKSTAQKQAMLLLVEDLNEAVPELSLAYDEQNDVLNMTADRMEALARAELERQQQTADIERLTVLYQEQAEIEGAMAEATANQTAAYEAYNEKLNEAAGVSSNYEAEMTAILQTMYAADDAVETLTATQATNNGEIEALTSKYGEQTEAEEELITTTVELTEKTKTYGERIEEATKLSQENTSATASLTDATTTLNGSLDSLSSAQLEQQENGALCLDTTLALIEAGYGNALSMDSETGAVTINKDTYLQLTKAKIADQQASINQQIASTNSALAAQQEALWYANLANATLQVAEAKAQMAESKEQLASLEAQKIALVALQVSLDSYTGAVVNYGSTVSGTSSAITSQAEQDLQTFKTLQAQLEHQRTIEEISQEEYYTTLASYRDDYLTDDANLDEYRSITEEIFSYDKSLAEDEQELWENQTQELIDQLQSRMDEILNKQAEMQSKLSDYGDLFEIDEDNLSLTSLQDQITVIEQYGEAMEALKERGIAQGLLEEITALDVDEALAYSQALLGMTEEDLEEYSALWEEKQLKALEISAAFYAEEARLAEEEFKDEFVATLDETKLEAFQGGVDTMQALIDGLASKMPDLSAMVAEINSAMQIISASSVVVDGSHADGLSYVPYDGYVAELHQGEMVLTAEEARQYIAQAVPQTLAIAPDTTGQETTASLVNGLVGALSQTGTTGGSTPVYIHLEVSGKELAKVVYDPLKQVKQQRGDKT